MGFTPTPEDEAAELAKKEAADARASYIAALEHEKAGYEAVGRKERAAEVEAEIKRAKGASGKQQKAVAAEQ
jgi:hypothetical protein